MHPIQAVLVVDDDPAVGSLLEQALGRTSDVAVHVVDTAAGAIALLEENDYRAMILDLVLARGSGFDVLEHARGVGLKTPVVVTSSYLPDYARELLSSLPLVRMIHPKPADPEVLAAIVRAWTE